MNNEIVDLLFRNYKYFFSWPEIDSKYEYYIL